MRRAGFFRVSLTPLPLVPLVLLACSSDLAVPQEAQLGCASDADCPSGWMCNEKVGRCVKASAIDSDAPALAGAASLEPSVLKKGVAARLSFEVSEELAAAPEVTVKVAGNDRAFSLDPRPSPLSYALSYAAVGDEPQGTDSPVTIVLTDNSGNKSAGISGGTLRFDFMAPEVQSASVEGSPVRKGGKVTVRFALSETPSNDPDVSFENGIALSRDAATEGLNFVYTYEAAGTETAEGATADFTVVVDASDAAGNKLEGFRVGTVRFDFEKPGLDGVAVVDPPFARAGTLVTATFKVTEELGSMPVVKVGGRGLPGKEEPGFEYVFGAAVEEGDPEGEQAVTIEFSDLAGNSSGVLPVGSVVVDLDPPDVPAAGVATDRAKYSAATGFDTIALRFDAGEDLDSVSGGLEAKVDNRPMECAAYQVASPNYQCTYNVTGSEGDGVHRVFIVAKDKAGNATYAGKEVVFDFLPPADLQTDVAPKVARLGSTVAYALAAGEPLDAANPPVLDVAGVTGWSKARVAGNLATWTRTVTDDSGENGTHAAGVSNVCDEVGNCASGSIAGAAVVIDNVLPGLESAPVVTIDTRYSKAKDGATVTIVFKATETLSIGSQAMVGGKPMTCAGTHPDYTCTRKIDKAEDAEGSAGITVKLLDDAGNEATISAGAVELDFTTPALISTSPSAQNYRGGTTVVYTANVTEPLSGNPGRPVVKVSRGGVEQTGFFGDPVAETETSFTFAKAVAAGMDGHYAVSFDLTDRAGNSATGKAGAEFTIDATAPAVTPVSVTTNNLFSDVHAKDGDTVTTVFDVDETLSANPAVIIGGRPMDFVSKSGTGPYTYTYAVLAAASDGGGAKSATATATDGAGNVAVKDVGSVTFDFTNPSVAGNAGVSITKPAGCPLASDSLGRLTFGSTAKVTFTVTEPLAGAGPIGVTATSGAQEFVFSKTGSSGLSYTYSTAIPGTGSFPQGAYALKITLRDAAGNEQTVTPAVDSPGLALDTAAPAQPDVGTTDKIVYKRIPWGSDATAGIKTFQIIGGPGAVDADTTQVLAFDGPDPATAAEIGRKPATGGTFGTIDLNRADRTEVHLASYDAACNRSQVVKVKDTEWTATMGYKAPGSSIENPNTFLNVGRILPALFQSAGFPREPSQNDLLSIGKIGGGSLMAPGVQTWIERPNEDTNPRERSTTTMAYDSARGRAIMFGGLRSGANLRDTWEWDGYAGAWVQQPVVGSQPSDRSGHAMVYDNSRGKVVLFGGWDGSYKQDTWEWDGSATIWVDRTIAGVKPAVRSGHSMSYDQDRRRVLVFGGMQGWGADLRDTWEWDPETGEWAERTPAGPKPTARNGAVMVYDGSRRVSLLFGGWSGAGVNQETWEWDGATGVWTDRTPSGPKPSGRTGHAMAYDGSRQVAMLFGGWTALGDSQETWEWNGTAGTWTPRAPASAPPARDGHGMVYDGSRKALTVFGGYSGFERNDTWEFDCLSGAWSERTGTVVKPSSRYGHALAFAGASGKVVMFGGAGNETWEWEGAGGMWVDRSAIAPKPAGRRGHGMAYDSARDKVVMFGGNTYGSDIWDYTPGVSALWTDRTPGGTKPVGRTYAALAYDGGRGKVVLFGGFDGVSHRQDTWEWDGVTGNWTDRTQAGAKPPERQGHAMAFDAARGVIFVFGGVNDTGRLNDSWEWDPDSGVWTERSPVGGTAPTPRQNHVLIHDASRHTMLMFGGLDAGGMVQDTWEWNGLAGEWIQRSSAGAPPSARYRAAMAYDNVRQRAVLFGGVDAVFEKQDTWEWDGGAFERPGQVMETTNAAAGLSATPAWKSVTSTFYSGGVGYPSGVATNGVDLKVWDEGQWKVVATNNASAAAPAKVEWATTDPQVISRLFFGDRQTLNFAVTPVAPNGTGTGDVSTDYSEVTVRYTLP